MGHGHGAQTLPNLLVVILNETSHQRVGLGLGQLSHLGGSSSSFFY